MGVFFEGDNCRFKRENKCKYFHPINGKNGKNKNENLIEISDYSMLLDETELDLDNQTLESDPARIKPNKHVVNGDFSINSSSIISKKNQQFEAFNSKITNANKLQSTI